MTAWSPSDRVVNLSTGDRRRRLRYGNARGGADGLFPLSARTSPKSQGTQQQPMGFHVNPSYFA